MIIVNTPHNPVGKVFTREELEQIAEVAKEFNLMVMSDEVVSLIPSVYSGALGLSDFILLSSTIASFTTGKNTFLSLPYLECGNGRSLFTLVEVSDRFVNECSIYSGVF